MCERVLILYRHPLFAEAVRRLLSVEADLEVHAAPLVSVALDEALETLRPEVVVLERPGTEEPEPDLSRLVSRAPRIISFGLADNVLTCFEGTTIASAGPDDLRRAVRLSAPTQELARLPVAGAGTAGMRELRWHGRGGQGVVTAAKMLAGAALRDGRCAQAFPEYGPERRGAPLVAFTRLADAPIRLFTPVERADVVVLLDPTLISTVPLVDGLKPGGLLLANWASSPEDLRQVLGTRAHRIAAVDATAIAQATLGRAIPNTVLVGALARLTTLVSWSALEAELREAFGAPGSARAEANVSAARRGYETVQAIAADEGAAVPVPPPQPSLPGWRSLLSGGVIRPTKVEAAPQTGAWRAQRPVLQIERCIHCLFCWVFCPDSAILVQNGRIVGVDYDHCKGCGICARECPVKPTAIPMVGEGEPVAQRSEALSA
ncbi:MAG: 2-oxoacid:acceptor oxidoreductase family protein [Chloroflexi bacterium]|nr:2-oxoacid:acceptor oxidoreductase family protein [Chloroflexota bacterium]